MISMVNAQSTPRKTERWECWIAANLCATSAKHVASSLYLNLLTFICQIEISFPDSCFHPFFVNAQAQFERKFHWEAWTPSTVANKRTFKISSNASQANRDRGQPFYFKCRAKTYMGIMDEVLQELRLQSCFHINFFYASVFKNQCSRLLQVLWYAVAQRWHKHRNEVHSKIFQGLIIEIKYIAQVKIILIEQTQLVVCTGHPASTLEHKMQPPTAGAPVENCWTTNCGPRRNLGTLRRIAASPWTWWKGSLNCPVLKLYLAPSSYH